MLQMTVKRLIYPLLFSALFTGCCMEIGCIPRRHISNRLVIIPSKNIDNGLRAMLLSDIWGV